MAFPERLSRFKLRLVAVAVAQLVCLPAFAADDAQRIEQLEQKLQQSMALIEQLSRRVNQLETEQAQPGKAQPAASATASAPAPAPSMEPSMHGGHMMFGKNDAGIPLHGFADIGYAQQSRALNGGRSKGGFTLGNLDLYLTPEFGDRIRSVFELVFEYGPESSGIATDLERIEFGYTFNDALTLWAGRFHTPYGYWNTAFHHGQQMQTAVTRPTFLDFEDKGGILPSHAVGLQASGNVRAGGGRVLYDAYIANGDRIEDRVLDLQPFADDNTDKLVGGNLRYAFGGALDGLTVGVHAFTQKVSAYDSADVELSRTRVNMAGFFGVYDTDNWEVLGEFYSFRNKDLFGGTGTHNSWAGFAQLGYRYGPWTPYLRGERTSLDQSDAYFAQQDSGRTYSNAVVGARYDLNASSALKLELNRLRQTQPDLSIMRNTGARVNWSVRF